MEQTLSIIKPDAVAKNVIGQIYSRFENAVHGSDSLENAAIEIAYFFGDKGVCPRTR